MAAQGRRLSRVLRSVHLLTKTAEDTSCSSVLGPQTGQSVICLRNFRLHCAKEQAGPSALPCWHQQHLRRSINIDQHGAAGEELSDKDYHRLSDLTLGELLAKLESLIEDTPEFADSDLEYQQGVLTLNLGSHGTYVINKQSPNKQIWMSSPLSGPVRYDFVDGQWIYKHDGHAFHERLSNELRQITGRDTVDLDLEPQVAKGFVGYGADPT